MLSFMEVCLTRGSLRCLTTCSSTMSNGFYRRENLLVYLRNQMRSTARAVDLCRANQSTKEMMPGFLVDDDTFSLVALKLPYLLSILF